MGKPVVLAVDGDPAALRSVEVGLGRRYLADYEVRCETSAAVALATLAEMRAAAGEVALVLADQWLSGMSGIDFLDRVHALHPGAKRALLISWGDQARAPALAGSALRRIDDWIAKPWAPGDEPFHQAIGQALYQWALGHRPRFVSARVVGEQWSARSHEIRDLLSRNSVPFEFLDVASAPGQALLEQVGAPSGQLPVVVLFDGRVLLKPSRAEVAGPWV